MVGVFFGLCSVVASMYLLYNNDMRVVSVASTSSFIAGVLGITAVMMFHNDCGSMFQVFAEKQHEMAVSLAATLTYGQEKKIAEGIAASGSDEKGSQITCGYDTAGLLIVIGAVFFFMTTGTALLNMLIGQRGKKGAISTGVIMMKPILP